MGFKHNAEGKQIGKIFFLDNISYRRELGLNIHWDYWYKGMTKEMAHEEEYGAPAGRKRPWTMGEDLQKLWRGEEARVEREINEVKEWKG